MNKPKPPISVRAGKLEFIKVNTDNWEWRDAYRWILSLNWPRFALFTLVTFFGLNLVFATAYRLGGDCIAEMPKDSFAEAFFFSVETLATVGYGHMYPATTYGHVVVTIEVMTGMFWTAVMTGLIFVRFSRPIARILFSRNIVISNFDGKPTLMIRVANLRHQSMVEAEFRMILHRDEPIKEDDTARRFYPLKLTFDRLISFPTALTIRHVIDESSPLYGATPESLRDSTTRFTTSVVCIDTVIPAPVQSQHDYHWEDVLFGQRFVEIYTETGVGQFMVDYGRLHDTETV